MNDASAFLFRVLLLTNYHVFVSDCSVIASRIILLLDDLLWVLTDTQLKSAMLYANSLSAVIKKSSQQSKQLAAEKLKVMLELKDVVRCISVFIISYVTSLRKISIYTLLTINNVLCDSILSPLHGAKDTTGFPK